MMHMLDNDLDLTEQIMNSGVSGEWKQKKSKHNYSWGIDTISIHGIVPTVIPAVVGQVVLLVA